MMHVNEVPAWQELRDERGELQDRAELIRLVQLAAVRARITQSGRRELENLSDHVRETPDLLYSWVELAIGHTTRIDYHNITNEQVQGVNEWQRWLGELFDEAIATIEAVFARKPKLVCPSCENLGNETQRYPNECPKHGYALEER